MLPQIKTVLHPSDLSAQRPNVFLYVKALARAHDADIAPLHVLDPLTHHGQNVIINSCPMNSKR
jgi:hypothetical protein